MTTQFFEEKRRRQKWIIYGAAASVAAAVVVALGLRVFAPTTPEVSSAPLAEACVSSEPEEILPGVWIVHCAFLPPHKDVDSAGKLHITLTEGAVGVSADPGRRDKAEISIRTAHGEIRVKGTVFTVHTQTDDSRVEVFHGAVSAWPGGKERDAFTVHGGNGAWLAEQRSFSLPGSMGNTLADKILAVTYSASTTAAFGQENGAETSHQKTAQSAKNPGPLGPAPNTVSEVAPLDTLLWEARACLVDKQWQCAAGKYRTIWKHYNTRWESMSALISLARIELRHLGQPAEAREHFATYQKRYPNGPLIEEAIFGMAECERSLGNTSSELRILRSFVRQHPQSALAVKAGKRIEEIEADMP